MKESDKSGRHISRREFARGGAMAAASAAVIPAGILSEAAAQAPAQEPALSSASQAEVDAKVYAVLHKYGQLLTDAEKLDIRRLLTEGQKPLETIRAFVVDNADQPGNVLRLYPDAPSQSAPAPANQATSVKK